VPVFGSKSATFESGALALPVIGRMVDRFGYRRIVLVCVPALSLLYLMIALQPGPFRIHLLLMVWGGIFGGGTSALAYTRPVIAAFRAQRGLALGVATTGTATTAAILTPIVAAVIEAYGWRAGLYTMSAVTTLVGLPLALALLGRSAGRSRGDAPSRAGAPATETSMALGDAVRTRRFWLLAVAFASANLASAGAIAQLAAMLADKGIPLVSAAMVMSAYALGMVIGRLATGLSLDRLPTFVVAAVITAIPALGMVLLRVPSASLWLAGVALLTIGLQQGGEVDLLAYIVSRSFGIGHYGAIYGALGVPGGLSTAASFVLYGKLYDLTGSYDLALGIGIAAFAVGTIAFTISGLERGWPRQVA
jgi:MFS family permease